MIVELYRKFISKSFRDAIYNLFLGKLLRNVRTYKDKKKSRRLAIEIPTYYLTNSTKHSEECLVAAEWIKKNGFSVFPYDFVFKYKKKEVEIFSCERSGLKYTLHNNRCLYFPRGFSKRQCARYYIGLLQEQDMSSPHRYDYMPFHNCIDMTLLDIGAAEGIFALTVIDMVEKSYLFECDPNWFEALEWTFSPYKEKVQIIHKYVSDRDNENEISLDTFLCNKSISQCYIKMDIEGAETSALKGAGTFLKNENVDVYISACAYHNENDFCDIIQYLENNGFRYASTSGVMIFSSEPPYFRKGMIYANRKSSRK